MLAATGDRQAAEKAGAFGRQLGLAFQIWDDLLGIWGLQTRTGKPAGADIARRKKSLPVVFGLAAGGEISDSIKSVYQQDTISEGDVDQVVRWLDNAGAQAFCERLSEEHKARALTALASAGLGDGVTELRSVAAFLVYRDY